MEFKTNQFLKKINMILTNLKYKLINKLFLKGGMYMMAMLWANQILLGKKTYAQVPALLKEQVKELLIDAGYEDLVTE